MAILLILLGAVLPLVMTPGSLFHYDVTPKILLLCVVLLAALFRVRSISAELNSLRSRSDGRLFAMLGVASTAWLCVAAAFSSRPSLSILGSGWREFGVAAIAVLCLTGVLVAAHLCSQPMHIALLLRAVSVAGLIVSIYGIAQYFDIDPFQSSQGYHALDGDSVIVRPPGTFGHADYFGWWLAIDFFCALAVAKTDDRRWQILGAVTACMTAAAVLLSGTRSAMVAMVAGGVGLFIMQGLRVRGRHLLTGATATALVAIFLFSPPGERLRARIAWVGHEPMGGARPALWRDSLRMAAAKPIAGFGPETFSSAFPPWESEALAHLFPDFHHESPHNLALDALTSAGLPGLLLILGWAVLAIRCAAGALRVQSKVAAPLAAALLASGVAAMFSAAVMPPLLLSLLIVGMLTASEQPDRRIAGTQSRLLLAGFAVPAAAGVVIFACLLAVSDYRLARFQRHPGIPEYNAIMRLQTSIAAEDVYCSRMLAASCSTSTGPAGQYDCWRIAIQAAARGTKTADDLANAWYNLAEFTAAQNDVRGTRMALTQATEAAPKWFKPHWAMAELLARTGDTANARMEADRAASLDANRNPEFSRALAQLKARMD